jgi:sulfite exporter TauE/SafE
MLFALVSTAFLMGLLGGAHCLVMCAAPCHAVVGVGHSAAPGGANPVPVVLQPVAHALWVRAVVFHAGRLCGYAAMGALAAFAMDSLAWLAQRSQIFQSVWTWMHVAMLAWGLMMVLQARQPVWLDSAGRIVWSRVRPWLARPGVLAVAGMAWGLLPCGLLYSALLVAALSGGAVQGGVTMAAFGVGSGLWLWLAPLAWGGLRTRLAVLRGSAGTRIAGLLLFAMAATALWLELVYRPSLWCR